MSKGWRIRSPATGCALGLLPHWTSEPFLPKSRGLGQSPKLGIAEPETLLPDGP
jgi:hypothetical protein